MRQRVAAACLLVVFAGCNRAERDEGGELLVLRVAAAHGLSRFVPGPELSGATAYALELAFEPLAGNARVVERRGRTVILERLPGSKYSKRELAEALRFDGLVRSYVKGERLVAVFRDEKSANGLGNKQVGEVGAFALGPYAVVSQGPKRVRLRARTHRPIETIELLEVDSGEQWKRLLGHQLDVLPNLSAVQRERFAGMGSVRIVGYESESMLGLLLNTRHPALSDVNVRRRLAQALDVEAMARIGCGDATCAAGWGAEIAAPAPGVRLPETLRVATLDVHAPSNLAARVIEHQLRSAGVKVEIDRMPIAQFTHAIRGNYEAMIGPIPVSRLGFERFTTRRVGAQNQTNYTNPEYDSAIDAGDLGKARRLLARDVPAIPLFKMRQFAAIDSRFCGDVNTSTHTSWRWIADLYPCKDGEKP